MKKVSCSDKVIYKELSYKLVGVLFSVYNDLGYGYQEKYYQKAVEKYLTDEKLKFKSQVPFKITLKGKEIGKYYLDLLIEEKVIVEIKKGNYFSKKNIEQVKAYLKVTGLKLAIIANFTSKGVNFLRIVNI